MVQQVKTPTARPDDPSVHGCAHTLLSFTFEFSSCCQKKEGTYTQVSLSLLLSLKARLSLIWKDLPSGGQMWQLQTTQWQSTVLKPIQTPVILRLPRQQVLRFLMSLRLVFSVPAEEKLFSS